MQFLFIVGGTLSSVGINRHLERFMFLLLLGLAHIFCLWFHVLYKFWANIRHCEHSEIIPLMWDLVRKWAGNPTPE